MYQRVRSWLGRWLGGGEAAVKGDGEAEGAEEADEAAEDSRFRPSPLDASVRSAYGDTTWAAERELANVEAKARLLDDREDG